MNNGSIEFCHLQLCLYIELCKQLKISGCFLFVDVVCAFANLVRVFLVKHESMFESDAHLLSHLLQLNMTENEISEFMKFSLSFKSWEEGGLLHLHRCISAMHDFSWFSLEHLEGVFHCLKGTLAGTALADLLFLFFNG